MNRSMYMGDRRLPIPFLQNREKALETRRGTDGKDGGSV